MALEADKAFELEAKAIAQQKAAEHSLNIRIIKAEKQPDGSKLIIYFASDNRVDFRELVKELASEFKTRIELRQIGVRDKAKLVGGLGPCGCQLCCTVFLKEFEPVSIKMAKDQDLPLNPLKISGVCGRLMCCLHYENEVYQEFKSKAPHIGCCVKTSYGIGRIVEHNVVKAKVKIEYENNRLIEHNLSEVESVCSSEQSAKLEEKLGHFDEESIDPQLKELEDN